RTGSASTAHAVRAQRACRARGRAQRRAGANHGGAGRHVRAGPRARTRRSVVWRRIAIARAVARTGGMTPMPRQKRVELGVARDPNGRRARARNAGDPAPAQVKRLRDAALAGLQSQEWGSELGRLFLAGKIGPELYAAGRRWGECVARYRAALGAPP